MIHSVIDSFYSYVAQQMLTFNAHVFINGESVVQPMCGIINARDWPQTPQVEGGLYLLFLSASPTRENSWAQAEYQYFCQWVWILLGTDITMSQQAQDRGDRYRANLQIMENLRQTHHPGFCQQKNYFVNPANGDITAVDSASVYPASPAEYVRWTKPRFVPKSDSEQSGLVYGAAAVELFAYSDVDLAVA